MTRRPYTESLGLKIHRLRKAKGYTLDRLAQLTGSSKSYIWELENKEPPRPSGDKVARIAAALGVTADYLLNPSGDADPIEAADLAFFVAYRRLPSPIKEKVRRVVEIFTEGGATGCPPT